MSIIAVKNVPAKMSLIEVVKELKKPIRGHFEALNFVQGNRTQPKTCYIRLSEKVDPVHAVQNINNCNYKAKARYHAFIPHEVPDLPLRSGKADKRLKRCAPGLRRQMRIANLNAEGRIIKNTASEILTEFQAKYPGLCALSKKYGHKLLKDLYKILYDRAKPIIEGKPELEKSLFQSTYAYRKAYTHSGDFELVLSTLHAVEEAAGMPKTELKETDISVPVQPNLVFDLPVDKVRGLCDKYTSKIVMQMTEHMNKFGNCDETQLDTEEEKARKKVRLELKKFQPFLAIVVNGVICKHFIPPESRSYKMRVYGEPNLPPIEKLKRFLSKHKLQGPVAHSKRMYNLMLFSIAPEAYHQLIALNGTVIDGSKLNIASSDVITYKVTHSIPESGEGDSQGVDEDGGEDGGEDEPYPEDGENWDDDEEM